MSNAQFGGKMSSLFNIIAVPLGWVMKIIYEVVKNYGLTIILFTLVTKILMFPLAIKQKKSTIKMAAFQPMIAEIQKKYATDKVKQQEEMARLQQEHGFSMTSGCLPLLIQMPILFGLSCIDCFKIFIACFICIGNSIDYRCT